MLLDFFKYAHKMFQNGELDAYKQVDTIEYVYMVNYNWLKKKYDTAKIRELTEGEKLKFNKNLLGEIDCEQSYTLNKESEIADYGIHNMQKLWCFFRN